MATYFGGFIGIYSCVKQNINATRVIHRSGHNQGCDTIVSGQVFQHFSVHFFGRPIFGQFCRISCLLEGAVLLHSNFCSLGGVCRTCKPILTVFLAGLSIDLTILTGILWHTFHWTLAGFLTRTLGSTIFGRNVIGVAAGHSIARLLVFLALVTDVTRTCNVVTCRAFTTC